VRRAERDVHRRSAPPERDRADASTVHREDAVVEPVGHDLPGLLELFERRIRSLEGGDGRAGSDPLLGQELAVPGGDDGNTLRTRPEIRAYADAKEAAETKAKTRASAMRIPWRTVLIWAIPVAAFAWLAIAGRMM
jgi:hypothetical protein